jgi:hypothetical protein
VKIPEKIKVGAHTYTVQRDWEDTQYVGQADHAKLTIRLGKGEQSKMEATFLHELLHCVDTTYPGEKLLEKDIDRLGEGLYQTLNDAGMFA